MNHKRSSYKAKVAAGRLRREIRKMNTQGTDKTDIPMTTLDTPNMSPATRMHAHDEHTIMEEAMKLDVNTNNDAKECRAQTHMRQQP